MMNYCVLLPMYSRQPPFGTNCALYLTCSYFLTFLLSSPVNAFIFTNYLNRSFPHFDSVLLSSSLEAALWPMPCPSGAILSASFHLHESWQPSLLPEVACYFHCAPRLRWTSTWAETEILTCVLIHLRVLMHLQCVLLLQRCVLLSSCFLRRLETTWRY